MINVTNAGNVDLTNVTLNDSLMNMSLIEPAGDNAPLGILNVGEIWTYTVNYTVTQEDIDNYGIPDGDIDEGVEGDIDNTATVDCDQLDPKSHSAEVPLGEPIYSIDKTITDVAGRGPAADVTAVGDIITYQINVSNVGNLDLSNITINDSLITLTGPEGDNAPVEILNVGEIWIYTGSYTVTQEDINNTVEGKGLINNTATVNSTQLGPINDNATAPISLPIAYSIDKIVTDVAGQGPTANVTAAGDVIEYQVNVINTGQVKLTNVTLNDSLIYLTGPAESLTADLILDIGEIWVYNGTYTVNKTDIDSNGGGDGFIENTATVDCDQLASKLDSAQVPIIQNPELTINKTASPATYSAAGQNITYTYNVTNTGNVNISAPINVTDDRLGIIPLTSGTLIPGQSETATANYTITQADMDSGSITNAAFATGIFGNETIESNTDNETVTAEQNPELTINKTASPMNYSIVGQNITYTYNVTNTGNVNISAPINVTDDRLGIIPLTSGILIPGQTETVTSNYTITQEDIDSGSVTNAAFATGIFGNNTTTSNTDNETVTAEQNPALEIEKSATPTNYSAVGELITYTYNVTNTGNVNITGPITVTDDKIGTVNITEDNLTPRQSILGNATYTITQADLDMGSVTNAAFATGIFGNNTTDSNTDNETVTAEQNPELTIEKSATPTNYSAVGDLITYNYKVTNTGNVNITGPITVTDDKIGAINVTEGNLTPGQSALGNATYTIIQADIDSGSITNAAFATGTFGNETIESNTDNETVTAEQNPELTIEKSASPTNYSAVGQNITYTYNITNTGNVNISAPINVTDDRLGVIPLTSGILIPGQSETVTSNHTITQSDLDSGSVTNAAFATGVFGNNTTTSNTDNVTVTAIRKADYTIDKIVTDVAGKGSMANVTQAGDVISYQINVNNTGNINLTNVTVTDPLLGNLTGPAGDNSITGVLEVGENWTFTGTYTVTQADIDSNGGGDGFIENTAIVDCDQLDPKNDSEAVPITRTFDYAINKVVIDVSGKGPEGNVTKAGDVVSYQINVTNTGNSSLTNVKVTDSLLVNLTGPVESLNSDGILEVGETWTYTGNYTVTQEDIDSNGGGDGFINNTATVDCDQLDPKSDSETVPIGDKTVEETPGCIIDKIVTDVSGKGPEGNVTKPGDIISYQINVTNTGNVNLTNVTVTDTLIENLNGPVESLNNDGVLEVGETWTYTGTYIVTLEDMISNGGGDGFINNTVTVDCDQLDLKSDSEAVPIGDKTVEEIPGCIIDKVVIDVAGKGPEGNVTKPGDVISYQINVTNTGNVNLTNVNVTDSLIENLNGPIESLNNNGVLEVGETWTYTGNYTVTQEDIDSNGGGDGFIENKATVSCDQLESMSDSAEVPIEKEPIYEKPEYCIHKSVIGIDETGDCIINEPGDVIEYQIVVKNEGNVDLTGVKVTDPMITLTGPDGDHIDSGVLNKGETWRFYGNYTITQEDINTNGGGDGCIENKATVVCDQLESMSDSAKVSIKETSIEEEPEFIIEKTVKDVAGKGPEGTVTRAGEVISYRIQVINIGNIDLTNVTVTDSLIENLNGPVESLHNDGIFDVGEIWIYTGNYTVTQEDIDSNGGGNGCIENKATVSCDQLDSVSDSAEVSIEKEPTTEKPEYCIYKSIIGIDKAGDCIINKPGDVIEYQIVVKNEGNVDLTGVKVTDPMVTLTGPDGDHIDSGVLNKGETWRFYGNYTVTQEDINTNGGGDGCIENKAIVSCNELPEESSIVNQPIILATDDDHHGNGGTGSAHIVSKPTKNTQVNKNTEEGSNTKIQIEADTEDAEQNNGNTETENEKEQEENENVSGFEVVYGIIGLLAIFLHKKK